MILQLSIQFEGEINKVRRPDWRILFEYETWERYYQDTMTYDEYNKHQEITGNYVPIPEINKKPEILKKQEKQWKYTED